MTRLSLAVFLAALSVINAFPQNSPEIQRRIRNAVETREYSAAITDLTELEKSDPSAFRTNDYDYLLARMAESNGELAKAMASYQQVVDRDSDLRAYALMHLSRIARSTGNLMLERLYLDELLLLSPDSLLASATNYRLARNSFECENYGETIRRLTGGSPQISVSRSAASDAFRRENLALLGDAYLSSGQTERAREIFTNLLNSIFNPAQPDDVAETAANALDRLDGGSTNKTPAITESEHLQRANIYQFNRDFPAARKHFEAIIADPQGSQDGPNAIFQIGRGLAQRLDFVGAIEWYERVQEQHPDSAAAKDALLQAASAYARVGKPKEAIKRYQKFIEKYSTDEKLDRAYLNIVDILRDQGDDTDALKWTAKTQQAFTGKLPAALALFAEARIYVAREDWQNALNGLEKLTSINELGGATVPGGTNHEEITFLKAFTLEQLKRYAEAIDAYLAIPDGRGAYYGWRATELLKLLSKDETASSFIAQKIGFLSTGLKAKSADARQTNAQAILRLSDSADIRDKALNVLKSAIKTLPKYQTVPNLKLPSAPVQPAGAKTVADKLNFLALYDEAAPEMAASIQSSRSDANSFSLADYLRRGDRADRGIAFIEPLWRNVPADYPIELIHRDQLVMLYPTPFPEPLLRYSQARKVDPRLMLAIMRQESRFQPDAKSNAAARGLMQFISTTSTQVAGELGRDNLRQDELYYPPTAILFGSQYLGDLLKVFPDQPDAVAASYNGGDDNMKRWLARSRSNLPDRYVPEIEYAQSKDYVYKVMANYRMYQYIYDEQLSLR